MSNFTLKIIAIVCMLIDHIGYMGQSGVYGNDMYGVVFQGMRCIGRIALPLFVFMIATGCNHTHDIKKYIRSLSIFALISEIPFDIFLNSAGILYKYHTPRIYTFSTQNVFFTLLLGVIGIYFYQKISKTKFKYLAFVPTLLLLLVAEFMDTDYGWVGVLGICLVYIAPNKYLKILALTLVPILSRWGMPVEMMFGFVAVLLVFFYNGKRGYNIKWLFYWFYPIHLAFLAMMWTLFIGKYFP